MTTRYPELAATLTARAPALAFEAARRHVAARPELLRHPAAEARCAEGGAFHLRQLASALAMGRPELFAEYLAWTDRHIARYGLERGELVQHVWGPVALVDEELVGAGALLEPVVAESLATLVSASAPHGSFVVPDAPHGPLARAFLDALLATDRREASRLVMEAACRCGGRAALPRCLPAVSARDGPPVGDQRGQRRAGALRHGRDPGGDGAAVPATVLRPTKRTDHRGRQRRR